MRTTIHDLKMVLNTRIRLAKKRLDTWKDGLETNPGHVLSWGEVSFEAVAELEVLEPMASWIERCEKKNETADINLMLQSLKNDMLTFARGRETSTSICSNLFVRCKLQAVAKLVDDIERDLL